LNSTADAFGVFSSDENSSLKQAYDELVNNLNSVGELLQFYRDQLTTLYKSLGLSGDIPDVNTEETISRAISETVINRLTITSLILDINPDVQFVGEALRPAAI